MDQTWTIWEKKILLRGQPSPTILYTDSLSQLADMARLYAVLC